MKNIDVYNNRLSILKKIECKIYIKFIISLIAFFTLFSIIILLKYPKLYKFEGYVDNDKVVIYLKKSELANLKGDVLKIKDEEIKYKIYSFSKVDYDVSFDSYYVATLIVEKKLVDNEIVNIVIEDGMTNLYESFVKKIWKGF